MGELYEGIHVVLGVPRGLNKRRARNRFARGTTAIVSRVSQFGKGDKPFGIAWQYPLVIQKTGAGRFKPCKQLAGGVVTKEAHLYLLTHASARRDLGLPNSAL